MADGFEITGDPRRRLLRIVVTGFLTRAHLAGYLARKEAVLATLYCAPNDHVILCDFSVAVPQSQEVLAMLKVSLDDPAFMSRRLAIVVSTALTRMQAQRIVTRPDAACFSSVADAEAWLFS